MYLKKYLVNAIKNNSLEKTETPLSGKHPNQSFRRAHESHRSGNKKTALERYISESLESLEYPKKKKVFVHISERQKSRQRQG